MENKVKDDDNYSKIKSFILSCHLISIVTNIILFIIFFMSEYDFKYIGIIIHILIIIVNIISIFFLLKKEQRNKNLKKYKSLICYFTFFIYASFLFYSFLLIYMYINKYDIDIFYFYALCIIFWGLFHLFFILVIKSFTGKFINKKKEHYVKMKDEKFKELF